MNRGVLKVFFAGCMQREALFWISHAPSFPAVGAAAEVAHTLHGGPHTLLPPWFCFGSSKFELGCLGKLPNRKAASTKKWEREGMGGCPAQLAFS